MLKFRNSLLAAAAVVVFGASTSAAMAAACLPAPSALCLDPSSPNNPPGSNPALDTGGHGTYPFNVVADGVTTGALHRFTSDLNIASPTGATTYAETGSFIITEFFSPPFGTLDPTSGVTVGYNVYGEFSITGTGTWLSATNFQLATAAPTSSVVLWANPNAFGLAAGNPLLPQVATATAPGTAGQFGITPGTSDFMLGTALIKENGTANGQALANGTQSSASFNGQFAFTPEPGTVGPPNGFFANLAGFELQLGNSATESPGQASALPGAGGSVDIVTGTNAGGCQDFPGRCGNGAGTDTFLMNVPEPASLSLLGTGLIAMGAALRRRRNRKLA